MARRTPEDDRGTQREGGRERGRTRPLVLAVGALALCALVSSPVRHVGPPAALAMGAKLPTSRPHAVFTFGRADGQFLPYSVVLRSDGAVVATSRYTHLLYRHAVDARTLRRLVRMARADGFPGWPSLLVAKTPATVDVSELFIEFTDKRVVTVPVHTPATRSFYRLLTRLMRVSRLQFCSLEAQPIPTPCSLVPEQISADRKRHATDNEHRG